MEMGPSTHEPPDIGTWRVERTEPREFDKTYETQAYRLRRALQYNQVRHQEKDEAGNFDTKDFSFIWTAYRLRSEESRKLGVEKGKPNWLEAIGILEATERIFKGKATLLKNSRSGELMVQRPPSYLRHNDLDYYVDIWPVDVKTASGISSETEVVAKAILRNKLALGTGKEGYDNKKRKREDLIESKTKKAAKVAEKYLQGHQALVDFDGGVHGSAKAVLKRLKTPALILMGYGDVDSSKQFDLERIAEHFRVQIDDLPKITVFPYVVVDTGFLSENRRRKFWVLIDAELKKDSNGEMFRRNLIEVQSCQYLADDELSIIYERVQCYRDIKSTND
jgi:hypothetical protein